MPSKPDSGHDWQSEHTRNGTFNVCANCKQTYGRHDKRCPKAREPIRETEIKPKPAPAVVARRAERIEIDNCGQCPWYRESITADLDYDLTRPALCASDGHGDGRPREFTREEDDESKPAPEWCPIRGMVVIIGGPRNA